MPNTYKGYKDLECYKQGRELRKSISLLCRFFPKDEKYQLTSQLTRAARSITANIAEGYGRFTYTDTKHFFVIARGSLAETMEHLTTAFDEGYIDENTLKQEEYKCENVFRLINGFIAYLQTSKVKKSN